MKLHSEINIVLENGVNEREYYNVGLGDSFTVDFVMRTTLIDGDIDISIHDAQVFNEKGRYMVLSDKEYFCLIKEIINKTNWTNDI